jgi:hypothetical protein
MLTKCSFSKHAAECEKYVCTPYQHKLLAVLVACNTTQMEQPQFKNVQLFYQHFLAISGFFFNLQPDILIHHGALILLYTNRTGSRFSVLDANTVTPVAFCLHITSRTAQVFMPPHNWSRATCAAHSNSSLFLLTNNVMLSCHLKFSWMAGHNFSILLTYKCGILGTFRAPWVKVYYS